MPARTGRQRSGLLRSAAEAWTLALLMIVYGLWATLALVFPDLPLWLSCPLLVLITVQFMSIQHEIVHGHPTRSGWLNEALVSLPLGLLFPYRRYRTLHLRHHNDENLTDPFDDPESWYFEPGDFAGQPAPVRWLWRANATLLGRLLLGPVLSVVGLVRMDLRAIFAGDRGILWDWVLHLLGVSAVLALLSLSGFSLLAYLAFVALPSMSVLMIRSFAEHRASEAKEHRTAIIPDRGLFALLF
ncbi:MAG: fatty acid desaturase, partial [Pseudomonadota bacterium]|nr:fatty acid desaturase [Pseudomonadota bacterium]